MVNKIAVRKELFNTDGMSQVNLKEARTGTRKTPVKL